MGSNPPQGGLDPTTVVIGEIDDTALVTSGETIAANINDITFPTSKAVHDLVSIPPSGIIFTLPKINDASSTNQYIFGINELTANRTITLPLLTANDEFVFKDHIQTLTNKTIDGDLNTIIDINETQMNVSVGASGTVLTSNGVSSPPTYQASGGEAFTWTADHSMTTFKLTATAVNDVILNAPTGQATSLEVNAVEEYSFNATQADWKGNNIVNLGILGFSANTTIRESAGTMRLDVGFGDTFNFFSNNVEEFSFSDAAADFKGNSLINVGLFESNATTPATTGEMRFGNGETIAWRNNTDVSDITLTLASTNYLTLTGSKGISLENNDIIRWDNNDARRIANDGIGFIFDVESGDRYDYKINDVDEYIYDATQADFNGNNLVNVGIYESNAGNPSTIGSIRLGNNQNIGWRSAGNADDVIFGYNSIDAFVFQDNNRALQMRLVAQHTTPTNGQEAAGILFEDDNSVGATRGYGQISVLIENPTSGSERGEMKLQLIGDSGLFESYIILNDADDDAVTIEKKLQIADTIDLKKITIPSDPPTEEGRLYLKQIDSNNNALFIKVKVAGSVVEVRLS